MARRKRKRAGISDFGGFGGLTTGGEGEKTPKKKRNEPAPSGGLDVLVRERERKEQPVPSVTGTTAAPSQSGSVAPTSSGDAPAPDSSTPEASSAARRADRTQRDIIRKFARRREARRLADETERERPLPRQIGESIDDARARLRSREQELLGSPAVRQANRRGNVIGPRGLRDVEKTSVRAIEGGEGVKREREAAAKARAAQIVPGYPRPAVGTKRETEGGKVLDAINAAAEAVGIDPTRRPTDPVISEGPIADASKFALGEHPAEQALSVVPGIGAGKLAAKGALKGLGALGRAARQTETADDAVGRFLKAARAARPAARAITRTAPPPRQPSPAMQTARALGEGFVRAAQFEPPRVLTDPEYSEALEGDDDYEGPGGLILPFRLLLRRLQEEQSR